MIDVGGMIVDTKHALDHDADPPRGPDVAAKPVGFGARGEKRGELGPLLGSEAMRWTRSDAAAQGFFASLPRPLQPLADRSLRHPQRRGDGALLPARLRQLPRPKAPPLAQIAGWFLDRCRHTRPAGTFQATFTILSCTQ